MEINQRGRRHSSRADGLGRPGRAEERSEVDLSPDCLALACESDTALVARVRAGERLAFGLLHLRHEEAAWRMANAVSGFSPEADDMVVEAFALLLASAPRSPVAGVSLRPDLLAWVRQVALTRGTENGRGGGVAAGSTEGWSSCGDEISLVEVEPAVAAAFRGLEEPERTALWLTEVEALTPQETGVVMELQPAEAVALAGRGRLEFRLGLANIFAMEGTASCRLAALHVATAGEIEPPADPGLAKHLGRCRVCRMRRAEAADVAAALRSVIPPSPVLGRPCHRRWRRWQSKTNRWAHSTIGPLLVTLSVLLLALLAGAWRLLGDR